MTLSAVSTICSTLIRVLRRRGLGAASTSGFGGWWRAARRTLGLFTQPP
jgi:hypothetical protein